MEPLDPLGVAPQDPTRVQDPTKPVDPVARMREAMERDAAQAEERRREMLRATLATAARTDPDFAARAARIARQIGVPPERIEDDAERLRIGEVLLRERELAEFSATHPRLERFLSELPHVRILHDDLGSLRAVSESWDWFRRNYEEGQAVNRVGYLQAKRAVSSLTAAESDELDALRAVSEASGWETGLLAESAELLGQLVEPTIAALSAGAVTGLAAGAATGGAGAPVGAAIGAGSAMFAHSAVVEFGHQFEAIYQDLLSSGVAPEEAHATALTYAGAYGIASALVETFAASVAAAPFVGAGKALAGKLLGKAGLPQVTIGRALASAGKQTVAGFASEVGEEGIQELLAAATETLARQSEGLASTTTLGEALTRAGEVMLKAARGMALLAPLGPALQLAADSRRVKRAAGAKATFDALHKIREKSPAAKRDPKLFGEVVAAEAEGAETAVYVPGPRLAQALRESGVSREQFARDLPAVAKALAEAEVTGDEVEIPLADFAAHVAGSVIYPQLAPAVRLGTEAFSAEQAEAWAKEREANAKADAEAVQKASETVATWTAELDAIEARILAELRASQPARATIADLRIAAKLHRRFIEVNAARTNKTPAQLDAESRLRFVGQKEGTDAALFDQHGRRLTSTDDFWRAFGESKVVEKLDDGRTEPLMLAHGTAADFAGMPDPAKASGELHVGPVEMANRFANGNYAGARLYPVFVRAERPVRLRDRRSPVWGADPEVWYELLTQATRQQPGDLDYRAAANRAEIAAQALKEFVATAVHYGSIRDVGSLFVEWRSDGSQIRTSLRFTPEGDAYLGVDGAESKVDYAMLLGSIEALQPFDPHEDIPAHTVQGALLRHIREGLRRSIGYHRRRGEFGALAKRLGFDSVVYTNIVEIPGVNQTELLRRVTDFRAQHKRAPNSEAEFRTLFPEAKDAYIVFDANQLIPAYRADVIPFAQEMAAFAQVSRERAAKLNTPVELPDTEEFKEAVANTPGASVTEEGLVIDVTRFQKPEQSGDEAPRTGVFYVPSSSPQKRFFRGTARNPNPPYGGTEEIRGETVFRRPLALRAAAGGALAERAYAQLKGEAALKDLLNAATGLPLTHAWAQTSYDELLAAVSEALVKFGVPEVYAHGVARYGRVGNRLHYAFVELVVAHALREAGYDSAIGYTKGGGVYKLREVFDVRELTFPIDPDGGNDTEIHPIFSQQARPMLASALVAEIDRAPDTARTVAGWREYLQAAVNKGRVKQAELDWSGFFENLREVAAVTADAESGGSPTSEALEAAKVSRAEARKVAAEGLRVEVTNLGERPSGGYTFRLPDGRIVIPDARNRIDAAGINLPLDTPTKVFEVGFYEQAELFLSEEDARNSATYREAEREVTEEAVDSLLSRNEEWETTTGTTWSAEVSVYDAKGRRVDTMPATLRAAELTGLTAAEREAEFAARVERASRAISKDPIRAGLKVTVEVSRNQDTTEQFERPVWTVDGVKYYDLREAKAAAADYIKTADWTNDIEARAGFREYTATRSGSPVLDVPVSDYVNWTIGGPKRNYNVLLLHTKGTEAGHAKASHSFAGKTSVNQIAHVRVTTRDTIGQEKASVRLLEEIQSDPAQSLRREQTEAARRGEPAPEVLPASKRAKLRADLEEAQDRVTDTRWALEAANRSIKARVAELAAEAAGLTEAQLAERMDARLGGDPQLVALRRSAEALRAQFHDAVSRHQDLKQRYDMAPDIPFAHTTEAWATLAVRAALIEAAAHGDDYFAIATGDLVADVYDYTTVVEGLEWKDGPDPGTVHVVIEGASGELTELVADRATGIVSVVENNPGLNAAIGRPLSDVFPAALATRMRDETDGSATGNDVTHIGGEGLRAFYGNADGFAITAAGDIKLDAKGNKQAAPANRAFRKVAKEVGASVDTIRVDVESKRGAAKPDGSVAAIKLTPELREKILRESLPLFQSSPKERRGGFDPRTSTAFLFAKADASTFLHEMAHYWLETLSALAAEDPNGVVRKDVDELLRWFGVKDFETWRGMTDAQRAIYHEQFAYSAELYLFEGQTPATTEEGRSLFRTFRRWLRATYRTVRDEIAAIYRREFGVELPALTDDVRRVFDRMLASEDAILAAEAERSLTPLFTERPAHVSPEEWQRYQDELREAHEAAVESLEEHSLAALRYTRRLRGIVWRRIQAQARERRAELAAQLRPAIEREPVHVARRALRHGTALDAAGNEVPAQVAKIRTADARQALADAGIDKPLPAVLAGLTSEDGAPADALAEMFGFATGADLIEALATAPSLDDAVEVAVDAEMLREHPELSDPQAIQDAIDRAVHNPARAKAVAAELRFLAAAVAPRQLVQRAAATQAREEIERTVVRDLRPDRHRQDAARARREAERLSRARLAGDADKAVTAKRRELLALARAAETTKARDEIARLMETLRNVFARPDARAAGTFDTRILAVARLIASRFGLFPDAAKAVADYVKVTEIDPDIATEYAPEVQRATEIAGGTAADWKDLTVADFHDLATMLRSLIQRARSARQVTIEGRAVALETAVSEIEAQHAETGKEPMPLPPGDLQLGERISRGWNKLKLLAYRPEHWAWRRDGAKTRGAFTRYFWAPIRAAVDAYGTARNNYTRRVTDLVRGLMPKLARGRIEFRAADGALLHVFGRANQDGHAELVAALLNTGNAGNYRRLLVGRGWARYDEATGVVDDANWRAFIAEQVKKGRITKDVMDFVQAVWNLNEELRPLAQRAHFALFGHYFDHVEATPVVFDFGTYRGGYMPAVLDPEARSAARIQSLADVEGDYRKMFATTGRGFTKARVQNFAEPLDLNLARVPAHVDAVLRFAYIQPAIRDIEKIGRDRRVHEILNETEPEVWERMLLPWLQTTASQSVTRPGKSREIDGVFRFLRGSVGLSAMAGNVLNALQQLTGFAPALMRVRPRFLFRAFWRLLSERGALFTMMQDLSAFMANRGSTQVAEVADAIAELQNPGTFASLRAFLRRHGYILQRAMQNLVDVVVWVGAYEQAIADAPRRRDPAAVEAEAVTAADAAVRMTQSSTEPVDVAQFEVGTPFHRVFTQFAGYFSTLANLQADAFERARHALGLRGAGTAAGAVLLVTILPALLSDAIVRTLAGRWDDEDDDGDVDVLTADFLFLAPLRSALAMVPVVGPNVLAPIVGMLDDRHGNERLTSSPVVAALERAGAGTVAAVRRALDPAKDVGGAGVRDVLTLVGILSGVPLGVAGRAVGYAVDRAAPAEPVPPVPPASAWETVQGLLRGPGRR